MKSPNAVPVWYRDILRLIKDETHANAVYAGMSSYPRGQVLAWLDELDTLGLVELVAFVSTSPSPDTTGNFSIFSAPGRGRST